MPLWRQVLALVAALGTGCWASAEVQCVINNCSMQPWVLVAAAPGLEGTCTFGNLATGLGPKHVYTPMAGHALVIPAQTFACLEWDDWANPTGGLVWDVLDHTLQNPQGLGMTFYWSPGGGSSPGLVNLDLVAKNVASASGYEMAGTCRGQIFAVKVDSYATLPKVFLGPIYPQLFFSGLLQDRTMTIQLLADLQKQQRAALAALQEAKGSAGAAGAGSASASAPAQPTPPLAGPGSRPQVPLYTATGPAPGAGVGAGSGTGSGQDLSLLGKRSRATYEPVATTAATGKEPDAKRARTGPAPASLALASEVAVGAGSGQAGSMPASTGGASLTPGADDDVIMTAQKEPHDGAVPLIGFLGAGLALDCFDSAWGGPLEMHLDAVEAQID